jgi:hypothetical protein
MNETTTDMVEYRKFLKKQIIGNRKSTEITWFVGLILTVLVVCYMSGLLYLVRGILVPATAARMIAQNIEGNIPAMMSEIELSVKGQAAPLADTCSKMAMAYLPKLREEAENQIDLTYQQWLPLLREEIRSTVHVYVVEHKDELQEIYATQKEPGFAKVFIDELADKLAKDLNNRLCAEQPGHDLNYVRKFSLNYLMDVNEQLSNLIKMKASEMTRSERLQRRMIVSWTRVIDELIQKQRNGEEGSLE